MYKYFRGIILIIVLFGIMPYVLADITINQCNNTLDTSGIYVLNESVNSTGTCFTITTENVTLDCNGSTIIFSINGSDSTYGVYTNKFNITITNCNIIDGNWTSNQTFRMGIFFENTTYDTLQNNTINTSYGRGIYWYNISNSTLTDNIVESNSEIGILIYNSSNNYLTTNTGSSNSESGINIDMVSNYNILINNTGTSNTSYGILLETSSNNTLINNTGTSNTSRGIYLYTSSNNTLIDNKGTSDSDAGIYLSSSNNNLLTSNTGISNIEYGIYIYMSSNNTLTSNNGTSNSATGILIFSSANNNILTNNTGTSDTGIGIRLYSSANNNILTNNTGTSNAEQGIYIELSSNNNMLTSNTGTSNAGQGIYIDLSSNNTLTSNNGTSNSSIGIYIYNSTNNILTENTGTSSTLSGIRLYSSTNNILTNNNGTSNTHVGIYLESSSNNNLTNNTGISNTTMGIYLTSSSNNILTENTGTSKINSGIEFYASSNNIFIGNNATGNWGYYIRSSNYNTISDCVQISGLSDDIHIPSDNISIANTFINCTYNISKEIVDDANNYILRQWYFEAKIINSSGSPIVNANVTIYNSTGGIIYSELTNSSGNIDRTTITEYVNTGGNRTYETPHTINVTKTGYTTNSTTYNLSISGNVLATIKLLESINNIPPNITFESNTDGSGLITNKNYIIINVSANGTNLNNITIHIYNSTLNLINITVSPINNSFVNFTVPSDGTYYFNATAYDLTNNSNSTETRNITIDTIVPIISFNYPTSSAITINVNSITINITANDTHFVNSTIYIYSGSSLISNQTENSSENVLTESNLTDGSYYYNVTAYDLAGNIYVTPTRSITIDTSTPTTTHSSGGGDSGGGGGSGVIMNSVSEENLTQPISFNQYWPNIINGSRTVNIDQSGLPITQIVLTTNNNTNVANTLTITAQPKNPTKENINAIIYTYIQVDTNIDQRYIDNISFKFKVDKRWCATNNITTNNITIYMFNHTSNTTADNWSSITASKYAEDTGYVYYYAKNAELSNMAIGGPIIPVAVSTKEDINTSIIADNATIPIIETSITTNTTHQSMLNRLWSNIAGTTNRIYNNIASIPLSPQSKSLIVIAISSILMLILGVVTGVLVYKNVIKPKRIRRNYNKQIVTGRIVAYTEEPPLVQTPVVPIPIEVKTDKASSELPSAQNPEFYVKKISELLMQCEYALDNGKLEDAKNYYAEARSIYFNSEMDYEHKSRVYDKIISLNGKLHK